MHDIKKIFYLLQKSLKMLKNWHWNFCRDIAACVDIDLYFLDKTITAKLERKFWN